MVAGLQAQRRDWFCLLALGLIGGGTFMAVEIALTGLAPLWLAGLRILFGGLVMAAIWALQGFRLFAQSPRRMTLIHLLAISLLSTVIPFSLISWGQQHVTSGFAAVAMASSALMVAPLAHFTVRGEQLTQRKSWGLIAGFAGVLVLIGPGTLSAAGSGLELLGQLACFAAASCYATSSIIVRRLPQVNPVGLVTVMLLTGASIIVPAALITQGSPDMPPASALGAVMALAVISTAGSNMLGILVIRSAGPTFMGLTNYITPVFAIILGAMVLGEQVTLRILAGFVLIALGLAIAHLGRAKLKAALRSLPGRLGRGRAAHGSVR
ncbi:DMT family transporter [Profundibacterium mesophilum]|uniref:ABC transporter membrane spanning protein n=1 Tax=Profundibacterium mesophilum KAUST100406-0324 TaxID=1037889 RepID=A0A921NT71_9RHOB|nr:DMT family transporter [Profundibacterium mesophilum]KAF0675048.1 ABC transporter membrane spanning protein [Profundibacterium mesophilum KAUST100406-0324]